MIADTGSYFAGPMAYEDVGPVAAIGGSDFKRPILSGLTSGTSGALPISCGTISPNSNCTPSMPMMHSGD